eukprot:3161016-Pyramimonas_sp.AAC.1
MPSVWPADGSAPGLKEMLAGVVEECNLGRKQRAYIDAAAGSWSTTNKKQAAAETTQCFVPFS